MYNHQHMKPVMLDLFCGSGGAAKGYANAGFDILGLDHVYQPFYPYKHIKRDFRHIHDLIPKHNITHIHASPPCHFYSSSTHNDHPDLVPETRELLESTGLTWVIENVPGAPLGFPHSNNTLIELCGTQFEELRVIRHRLFESNFPLVAPVPCMPAFHPPVYTTKKWRPLYGKLDPNTSYLQVTGHGNSTFKQGAAAMGIDWFMYKSDLNQCVPPAYTEYIGKQLLGIQDGQHALGEAIVIPWTLKNTLKLIPSK